MGYCTNCGSELTENALFCPNCGHAVKKINASPSEPDSKKTSDFEDQNISPKSRMVTFFLALFVGPFGAHYFYIGKTSLAVCQLILTITGFILYIGGFIDMIISTERIEIASLPALFLGLLFLSISGFWAFITWIMALCGSLKDKNNLPVTKWFD